MRKPGLILVSIFVVWALAACGGAGNSNLANANTANAVENVDKANTNVEELGVLINVPYESEEAFWKRGDNKVIAVLRFPDSESNRLVTDASKIAPALSVSIAPESWFPAELIAQSGTSGENDLKGQSYPANSFYQEPYVDGRITRIENTGYFVLELTSR